MKRLLFVFTLIVLTANLASAQEKEAIFVVDGDSIHDFGTIKEADGPVTHIFTIKNAGQKPLVITNVNPSCGCTTPDWTKEPIAPGKKGEIKITYDPTGRPAPFTKTISVYSNGKTGTYILSIKGVVEPKT